MLSSGPPNRATPRLPIQAYTTFEVRSPLQTHFKSVTCRDIECIRYVKGWKSALDMNNPEHRKMANWIRLHSGRKFTYTQAGQIVTFAFPAGQRCFETHKIPVGKPEIYVVRGGDWRGNPTGMKRRHTRPEHFAEEFALNQDKLQEIIGRG